MTTIPIHEAQVRHQPLHAYVEEHAQASPDRTAIVCGGSQLTFGRLQSQVEQLSAYLSEQGVGHGDTVALFMQNSPQFVVSLLAVQRLGATAGPCNPMFKQWELEYQLNDLDTKVLITFDDLVPVFEKTDTGVQTVVLTRWSDVVEDVSQVPVEDGAEPVQQTKAPHTARYAQILKGERTVPPAAEIDLAQDPALIIYTSGTTGQPKGAMLSYRNVEFKTACTVQTYGFTSDDVFCAVMPIFHIAGMTVCMNSPLMVGGTMVIEPRFDPGTMIRDLERHAVTVTYTTPPMNLTLLDHPALAEADLSAVRLSPGTSFGIKITREISDRWEEATGAPLFEWAYGMSETHTGDTQMPPEAIRYGSHGKPTFDTDVRISDPEDPSREMPQGELGEILVSSPSVFLGYRGREEATQKTMYRHWYRSGDLGRIDSEGYLYFEGRNKDLIKSSGYSVFPEEVERMLVRHEAVAQAAVVGYPDPQRGESVRAFVILEEDQSVTPEELIEWSRERMAAYKYPRDVRIIQELPTTTTGKLQYAKLRDLD